ncbi:MULTISPECIES: Arm DNA-binding domain-containing protein [unclassified Gilliamella]|uniref:Arm DNA-binding domain-containing protein n=1 Tax=unclassified Gilliamella TaxID=2685620 RepID=UPI002FF88985
MPDPDCLYVVVLKTETIVLRYDYRINERREIMMFGKQGEISLSEARDKLLEVKEYWQIIFLCEGKQLRKPS